MKRLRRLWPVGAALVIAAILWLPLVHFFFRPALAEVHQPRGIPAHARALAARQVALWTDDRARASEIAKMRRSNAEWDFMGRTFLVLSLAEMSLREPALTAAHLAVMDTILDQTLQLEREHGPWFFLMPYAKARPFLAQPVRSLFVDGEIALMLAARQTLGVRADLTPLLRERVEVMIERMRRSPALAAESYPDECWMFDHVLALAAIRFTDQLHGTDHAPFLREWLARAKTNLVDPATGLLVSQFTATGQPLDGPEGSTIWMVAHALRLLDEDFARDQYTRARRELGRELCGFGWSREWPKSWRGPVDIDSGAVIPLLDVSAGASGLAFIGAASFGDLDFLRELHTTLAFAAFPQIRDGQLRYCASNPVGDAVMLYAGVLGPLWDTVKSRKP